MNIEGRLKRLEGQAAPRDGCPHYRVTYTGATVEEVAPMPPICAECDAPYVGEIIVEYVNPAGACEPSG